MVQVSERKTSNGITLVGLGPGAPEALTREAWAWLTQLDTLYVRTKLHPTIVGLPQPLVVKSFDEVYETTESFEDVYEVIIQTILKLGSAPEGVTYAVPGHPFVAEATCPEIAKRATAEGIPVRIIDGLSFLEPTFRALAIDPFPDLMLADAITLGMRQTPEFSPALPVLIAQIYSREIAADVKLTLMALYPDEHPVRLINAAGTPEEVVEEMPLYAIDQSPKLGLLSSLWVPPLSASASFESFQEIVARLRSLEGCPWDQEQTHLSLRPFLIEEAYEALDALDREDMSDLQEELGDLLLQIVLHAQIATEEGDFNISHVIEGIGTKLIRRHPHVFSEVEVADVAGVIRNWETIKAEERQGNRKPFKKGLLDGVPKALPALLQAEEIVERVGRVEFGTLAEKGDPAQLHKALSEFLMTEGEHQSELLGELLIGLVSFTHQIGLGAEDALRLAVLKFRERFGWMEAQALAAGTALVDLSVEAKQALWAAAGETREDALHDII